MAAPTQNLIDTLPRHLRMRELRVFVTVLEHRSFGKAAAALNVTQPAVTKAIAGLEETLGVKLFDRSANGVEPTVHGTSFAPHARAIFSELRSAAQQLAIVSSGAKGTLHIGTVPMPAAGFLPLAVRQLIGAHPNIFVSVIEARELELAERLRKREIDLGIVRLAYFDAGDDIRSDVLFDETLCVLAGRNHPLAGRQRVTWKELLNELWVLPPADSYFYKHVRRTLDLLDLDLPRHAVESISIHVQYSMVLHGSMLSFGSRSQIMFSPIKDFLVRLPFTLPTVPGTIGAVTLRGRQPTPLAEQLIGHIRGLAAGR
jgi:DNA-binding transcriptional LysR family regulator